MSQLVDKKEIMNQENSKEPKAFECTLVFIKNHISKTQVRLFQDNNFSSHKHFQSHYCEIFGCISKNCRKIKLKFKQQRIVKQQSLKNVFVRMPAILLKIVQVVHPSH